MEPSNPAETLLQRLGTGSAKSANNAETGPAMDLRDYGLGAQILSALGLKKIRLLTRQPRKVVGLEAYGIELVEQIELKG